MSAFRQKIVILILCASFGFSAGAIYTFVTGSRNKTSEAASGQLIPNTTSSTEVPRATANGPVRIVYLSSNEANDLVATAQAQNVAILHEPNAVKIVDSAEPLDAFLFDSSFSNKVDLKWLRERYAQGLVVVGVNVNIVDLAHLVGDTDALTDAWTNSTAPAKGNFYSMLYFAVSGNPAEVERFKQEAHSLLDSDGNYAPLQNITSGLAGIRGKAQVELSNLQDLSTIFKSIQTAITSIKDLQSGKQP